MFLWLLVAILAALLFAVGAYAYPFWINELRPSGGLTLSIMPQLLGLIIEIVAIVKLSHYFSDRKWLQVRRRADELIAEDLKRLSQEISGVMAGLDNIHEWRVNTPYREFRVEDLFHSLIQWIEDDDLIENLQLLAPGFSPEQATALMGYMKLRAKLTSEARTIDKFYQKLFWYAFFSDEHLAKHNLSQLSELELLDGASFQIELLNLIKKLLVDYRGRYSHLVKEFPFGRMIEFLDARLNAIQSKKQLLESALAE